MEEALQHAGLHAGQFLSFADSLALRVTSRTCNAWFRSTLRVLATPISKPQHWKAFIKASGSHLSGIKTFPTTVFHMMHMVNAHALRSLDLSRCGLTRINVERLLPFLQRLSGVQHVSLDYNTQLCTEGVVAALNALGTAGAQLRSLSLVSTGLDATFNPVAVPGQLVKSLHQLNLCLNSISDKVVQFMLLRLPRLRRVYVDIRGVATAAYIATTSGGSAQRERVEAIAFCECDAEQARHLLGLPRMRLLAMACPLPLSIEGMSVGVSLTQLSLMLTKMSNDAWTSFFVSLGRQTSLAELVLHHTKGVTGASLAAFMTNHRQPRRFVSLGLMDAEWCKGEDVRLVLKAMRDQKMRLRKCTLDGCTDFRLQECCAGDVVAILDPIKPVYMSLRVPKPLLHALYRQEAVWLNTVLSSGARFSHLGLEGRYLVMDKEPGALAGVEHLSLDHAETSWTLDRALRIRTLSMNDVQPPPTKLVQHAFSLDAIEKLRLDYCHLEAVLTIGPLRCLQTLNMNWCRMANPFYGTFLQALTDGKMPQLSYLGIRGTPKTFVCLVVAALQGRGRNCHLDAKGGAPWTETDATRLRAALGNTQRGDVSGLTITLSAPAAVVLRHCLSDLQVVLSPPFVVAHDA